MNNLKYIVQEEYWEGGDEVRRYRRKIVLESENEVLPRKGIVGGRKMSTG